MNPPESALTVADEIDAQAPNAMVRLAMRLGALLEGGTLGAGPEPAGDSGTSFGPFQIHLPAHPGVTAAQADDPTFAVHFMLPAYTSAAKRVPAGLWSSSPELAAEQTAYLAERPARDYIAGRGQKTVDNAWKVASGAGAGAASPPGSPATGGAWSPPAGPILAGTCDAPGGLDSVNPLAWGSYLMCVARNDFIYFALTGVGLTAGAALMVAGFWRTVSRSAQSVQQSPTVRAVAAAVK